MNIKIIPENEFKRQFKRLMKRYPSLKDDIRVFQDELMNNPYAGVDLGKGIRKVRMSIASKGKGKSGGARVITFSLQANNNDLVLRLLTIYDKSEIENVRDSYLKQIIDGIDKNWKNNNNI